MPPGAEDATGDEPDYERLQNEAEALVTRVKVKSML